MPAVAWWGYGIAVTALVLLLGGMYALVRAMSDDSGKYEEIKKMLDPIFHTPSFLRPGSESGEASQAQGETAATAAARAAHEPFEDECPGCRERVTHEHAECPSCGLRLLG
ncbi:hypothetical protein GE107_05210 [Cohnella sp. CFH 77786]|uniref:hypothetical protein n=1 Tax=Cohnella sp. CFH 77786 TaxID=2662265 RepID=UPI001C608C93|nr:hypothetical protein [Cohnella sp. CFH 77786]MBW5445459.1 hypothetical protein [Cohnella sp. CFH 77786]